MSEAPPAHRVVTGTPSREEAAVIAACMDHLLAQARAAALAGAGDPRPGGYRSRWRLAGIEESRAPLHLIENPPTWRPR